MAGADASFESEPTPEAQPPSQSGQNADHPSCYTCEHPLQERCKMITNM